MQPLRRRLLRAGALALFAAPSIARACAAPGVWLRPRDRTPIADTALYAYAARRKVVLLGEAHDVAAHHRWQLRVLEALRARAVDVVLGCEMFPRRVQPVLDRWVAGEISEAAFLDQSDWTRVWRYDAAPYLPLFRFARVHRIAMRALNVERTLVREVGARGFTAVAPSRREGVSRPAPASARYVARLREIHARHGGRDAAGRTQRADHAFARFVEAQLLWDRAMAEGIVAARAAQPDALVVAIMGSGHIEYGFGVPHQLAALGERDVLTLLPVTAHVACASAAGPIADTVYGVADDADAAG